MTGKADLEWHLQNTSALSLAEYIRHKRGELAKVVSVKKRIYLDQRYWIQCRDAERGLANPVRTGIWRALRNLVRAGKAICPITSSCAIETYKQSDGNSRRMTAEVMDELSCGLALRDYSGRRQAEFQAFAERLITPTVEPLPAIDQAFSWPLEIFGELHTQNEADSVAMGKAAFDALCRMRFPDVLSAMPSIPAEILERARGSAANHNRIAAVSSAARRAYAERLRREILSTCRRLSAEVRAIVAPFVNVSSTVAQLFEERWQSLLLARFDAGLFKNDLPSEYIQAVIYAATDHKRRLYRDGDFFDHQHAIAALPYCDFFFTESALGTLLTESPAKLDSAYNCRVLWDDGEILSTLRSL